MAPRLPDLQEPLDNTRRDAQGEIVGVSVQGQGWVNDPHGSLPTQDIPSFCTQWILHFLHALEIMASKYFKQEIREVNSPTYSY